MLGIKPNTYQLPILLYHGVSKDSSISKGIENKSGKHIDRLVFIEQLRYIKSNFNPISMDQVVSGTWPKNPIAITFDDGFENNYTVAAPLLDEFKVPATFYLTAGIINTDMMFWVDILEDCINFAVVQSLIIQVGDKNISFKLGLEKYKSLSSIKQWCKSCSIEDKNQILTQVIKQTKVSPDVGDALNYRKLNWGQVKKLHNNPIFTIGGHSLYHDILSQMDDEQLVLDISTSIGLLNYNLNTKIKHYSYPEGLASHYDERVIAILKAKGIKCSPTAIFGLNTKDTDLFRLHRVMM